MITLFDEEQFKHLYTLKSNHLVTQTSNTAMFCHITYKNQLGLMLVDI